MTWFSSMAKCPPVPKLEWSVYWNKTSFAHNKSSPIWLNNGINFNYLTVTFRSLKKDFISTLASEHYLSQIRFCFSLSPSCFSKDFRDSPKSQARVSENRVRSQVRQPSLHLLVLQGAFLENFLALTCRLHEYSLHSGTFKLNHTLFP